MIGLDTNVLVRYIVQDDPGQAAAAERIIEGRCTAQAAAARPGANRREGSPKSLESLEPHRGQLLQPLVLRIDFDAGRLQRRDAQQRLGAGVPEDDEAGRQTRP